MRKIVGLTLTAAIVCSMLTAPASAEGEKPLSIYGGYGIARVMEDPTDSGKGNVFFVDGYEASRGEDKEKGNNPFLEIPWEYIYDYENGMYQMKKEFSVSFDMYNMATGYRYGFYTGTDDFVQDDKVSGMYFVPDTGSACYLEGLAAGEKAFSTAGEYVTTKKEWHSFTITRKNNKYTLLKDGKTYCEAESDYDYASERVPVVRLGYSPYSRDAGVYAYFDNIEIQNGSKVVYSDTADSQNDILTDKPVEPEQITVNKNISDGSETQKRIDSRPDIQRRMENLDRGLVAVNAGNYGLISWRWLGTEAASTKYNLYKNGEKVNAQPLNITNYIDYDAKAADRYSVAAVTEGVEAEKCPEVSFNSQSFIEIPLDIPKSGITVRADGEEEQYSYIANDATTADLDGDGEYEIILKWDPSNSRDSANLGATGPTIFDAYKLDGTKLWRINLGKNIRSGAHDTQMLAADFNGDGKGEFALKTADGTIAGDGKVIGDPEKDWRDENGKNLSGPLYITVFDGETGAEIDTVDYIPQSQGAYGDKTWDIESWGDDWGNRSERYNAAVAYLDGDTPSMVFARGYYDRTALAAFSMEDNKIKTQWVFDTYTMENQDSRLYRGQGNHSVAVADVDYDGCDEIVYGAEVFDQDGTVLYSTGFGHGDAQHTGDLVPDRPGLETFSVHESGNVGHDMRDARTGEIIWSSPFGSFDVGRGTSADVDPRYEGAESWSSRGMLISAKGELITDKYSMPANFLTWWDGDLGREVQDSINISKWNPYTNNVDTIFTAEGCHSNNAGKANPTLTADLFGDWREEVVYPLKDNSALRIYTTTIPTAYRIPSLMSDTQYRMSVAVQNIGYNQPAHVSYNLGYDTKTVPVPQVYVMDGEEKVVNPDLKKKAWSIEELYDGDTVELAVGHSKALVNGVPYYIDNTDESITPYIENDRTMVPYRFLTEALGANVIWDSDTKSVTVKNTGVEIVMTEGSPNYTVNGKAMTMDTAPEIRNDRIFLPVRAAAEAMGMKVAWSPEHLIVIGTQENAIADAENVLSLLERIPVSEIHTEKAYKNGEKIENGQAKILKVETSDGSDGAKAFDLNYDTVWQAGNGNIIRAELDGHYAISTVYIAFADGDQKQHDFKVYTKWDLSKDDEEDIYNRDGWAEAVASSNSGMTTEPEKYIFPVPKYGNYVKVVLTDPEDSAQISEIAVITVE